MASTFIRNTRPVYNYKLHEASSQTDIAAAVRDIGMNYQSKIVPFPPIPGVEGEHNVHGIVRGQKPGDLNRRLIGVVKGQYQIVQHSEFVNMWKPVLAEFPLVQVGSFGAHDVTLLLGFELADFNLGGLPTERVKQFLYTANTNDGTSGITAFLNGRRMACLNQFRGMLKGSRLKISIRHGAQTMRNVQDWTRYIGAVKVEMAKQREQLELLLNPIADADIAAVFEAAYPTPRSTMVEQTADLPVQEAMPRQVQERRRALEMELARTEEYRVHAVEMYDRLVRDVPDLRGSGWAALNAVTEAETWRAGRGAADSLIFGERAKRIERAFEAAAQAAGLQN